MIYKLKFLPIALKEWNKLDNAIKKQLKKKLEEVIQNPKIQANRLRKFENHYKVKLKSSGYRLVYEVIDDQVVVLVIAIGKREGNKIYEVAKLRT
ncbi:MAG: type II toxin-antitoxin system RelE/ParE family toxin [Desulforegulaceae bacterium]|nr:type II toxin-antitoxin system RelE/ParE family toxin [Desulforegulaceae bacterium]